MKRVAPTNATVLLLGETGTGKELVARAIHQQSHRRSAGFFVVDCGALPPTLIESELFGHEKGAFTGAVTSRAGRFEMANHGTLLLDEVGDMPLELQPKLLRVLQEGEASRLGSTRTTRVDVRIIAATNRSIAEDIRLGRFRSDLFFRLNVFPITLPALRERREDLPMLVRYLGNRLARQLGKRIDRIAPGSFEALQRHDWPGNIRELENVLQQAIILAPDGTLDLSGFTGEPAIVPAPVSDSPSPASESPRPASDSPRPLPDPDSPRAASDLPRPLSNIEREYIEGVLERVGWRIEGPAGAAEVLGLRPSTLRGRMHKLGIQRRTTGERQTWPDR